MTPPTVENLLKDVQNAIGARALYPADHPRTREGTERIERQLREFINARGDLSVFALEDKVVYEGNPLAGSEPIARGLFKTLRACGYDRLTIKKGLTREELAAFLAVMAEASKRSDALVREAVKPTANIRLSSFKQAAPGAESAPLTQDDYLSEEVEVLGDVWSGVVDNRNLDLQSVEGIVVADVALSKTIEENLGAMIPMATLKSYDEYTATHIINVALLAMALAEAIGMPGETVHDIGIAALLHDVGKLQVPEAILNKPDRLTEQEFNEIKRHPEEGSRILFSTPGVPELAVIVAYEHHIRFDRGGYPPVPSTWRINLGSAVTQIADIYDALRTDRPYRRGLDRDTILRMMTTDAGKHFDPDLLGAFFDHVIPKTSTTG